MNLTDLKKSLRTLPDDGEMAVTRDVEGLGRTFQGFGNNGMVEDLKALADSHDALLEAAKRQVLILQSWDDAAFDCGTPEDVLSELLVEMGVMEWRGEGVMARLAAIEQAEK